MRAEACTDGALRAPQGLEALLAVPSALWGPLSGASDEGPLKVEDIAFSPSLNQDSTVQRGKKK